MSGEYPEHDKMATLRPQIQAVTDFLEWLDQQVLTIPGANAARYEVAIVDDDGDRWTAPGIERLLAEHFSIDQDKLEAEKRTMLAKLRELNGLTP